MSHYLAGLRGWEHAQRQAEAWVRAEERKVAQAQADLEDARSRLREVNEYVEIAKKEGVR